MKIVVIGGSGLIGTKLCTNLRGLGHEALPASPRSGVDVLTGKGLAAALEGAAVVVDVSNSPSFEDAVTMEFFETSGRNLRAAESNAGVGHHVALSVVGTERMLESGYFRAKLAQERGIERSPIPYTIVRATQFFEFVDAIGDAACDGDVARATPALIQPIASDDVAKALAGIALAPPRKGMLEIAGPDAFGVDELVRINLRARGDTRTVVTDPDAGYFGARLDERTLVPDAGARLGETRYEDWLRRRTR